MDRGRLQGKGNERLVGRYRTLRERYPVASRKGQLDEMLVFGGLVGRVIP